MATVDDAWVAVKILQELIETPFMRHLHFEFDIKVGEVPTVMYTIERSAIWETFNEKGE